MKKYLLSFVGCLAVAAAVAQTPNYVRTWDAKAPVNTSPVMVGKPLREVQQQTQYIDGLGRPVQTVIKQGSLTTPATTGYDVVSPIDLDVYGKEVNKYLPYVDATTTGLYKTGALTTQQSFNNTRYSGETNFYSATQFETSPFNRPLKTLPPGANWGGANRGQGVQYLNNTITDDVKIWNVTDDPTEGNFGSYTYATTTTGPQYPPGVLQKTITTDEAGKQVIEFKDKEGKVILKRVQLKDVATNLYSDFLNTYYIYDIYGNLRCVIQPRGVEMLWNNGGTFLQPSAVSGLLNEFCFRYEYDKRNRMIVKKVPGAGSVEMVYDGRDRMVMMRDAKLTADGKWLVTKYDDLDRPAETGLWTNAVARATHQTSAYSVIGYPTTSGTYELLTKTGYDNYSSFPSGTGLSTTMDATDITAANFLTTYGTTPDFADQLTASAQTNGLPTWTQTKVLGTTSTYLYTVMFYDVKGRVIQQAATNKDGGYDRITTQYDFAGKPLRVHQDHSRLPVSGTALTDVQTEKILTTNNYDDLGRVLDITKKLYSSVIGGTNVIPGQVAAVSKKIVANKYDNLGQLINKKLSPDFNSGAGVEALAYDYNIRGWLLGVNRPYIATVDQSGTTKFGFELGYDKLANNSGTGFTTAQYNGNISGMIWKSDGDDVRRKYDFTYDAVNRLMTGNFTQDDRGTTFTANNMNYSVQMGTSTDPTTAYDANGNIKAMKQFGWKLGGSTSTPIDNLTYDYTLSSVANNTNRLQKVTDAITGSDNGKLGDFKDGSNGTTNDYSYDVNGNMTADQNKNISSIVYNHLNLPQTINLTGSRTIVYSYDAGGNKLQKVVTEPAVTVVYNGTEYFVTITTTTVYVGGMVYESKQYSNGTLNGIMGYLNRLQFMGQEEGRIRYNYGWASPGVPFAYDYFVKDHLGNVRMVLTDEQKIDKYPVASMEDSKLATERLYYSIDDTKISPNSAAAGLPAYTNGDNGVGNNPNDPTFDAASSTKLYRIKSNENKTGLGITLKVMAGDVIDVWGRSYYPSDNSGGTSANSALPILDLLTAFLGGPLGGGATAVHGAVTPALVNTTTNVAGINSMFSNQTTQNNAYPTKPKAFINYILFDEQFKAIDFRSSMIETGASRTKQHHADLTNIAVPKNGYVYIYCSNESPVNVFFDNLQVIHTKGPIVEETHYYPFGLTMAGISSRAATNVENRFKYNGKEEQRKEFSDGSGLEWMDYGARMYDAQIGRWTCLDPLADKDESVTPYCYVRNNPVILIDPNGKEVRVHRRPIEYANSSGTLSIPDRVSSVHDLGVTGIDNGFKGVSYKRNGNGSYDVSATIISLVHPKLQPTNSYNKLMGQSSLGKEVESHEKSHGDQFEEALKASYSVKALTVSSMNSKGEIVKNDIIFSGSIDEILQQADAKFDQLKKGDANFTKNIKLTKDQFIESIFNITLQKVSDRLNSIDLEKDANKRAAVYMGGAQNMPYTLQGKPIRLPQ